MSVKMKRGSRVYFAGSAVGVVSAFKHEADGQRIVYVRGDGYGNWHNERDFSAGAEQPPCWYHRNHRAFREPS